jgi:hypothetical protein
MVVRIKVTLEQYEYSALLKYASCVMRNPEEQVRFMLIQKLRRLGYLSKGRDNKSEQDVHQSKLPHEEKL